MDPEKAAGKSGLATQARSRALPNWARLLLVAIMLLSALAGFFVFDLDRYLSIQTLADNRDWLLDQVAGNAIAVVLGFIAIYTLVVAASVPGATVLTITGGFLFGTVAGAIYAVTGATLGAIGLFLFIRTGLGNSLRARADTSIERFKRGFHDNAFGYLLFLRLLPLVPFWFVNIAAAVLEVPLLTFVLATAMGIIPGSVVYASFGSGVGFILDEDGTADIGGILTPEVLLPLIGLALLALAPILYKTFKRRRLRSAS
jgi:uncharacterized membrane protein YdjX (TVP38/TMEM64 family)